jgi:hypothetical protein
MTLASFSGYAGGMAVNSADVFWTTQAGTAWNPQPAGPVMYCPFGGSPSTLVSDPYLPGQIAVDSTNAYWIDQNDPPMIMSCSVGGCAQPNTVIVLSMPFSASPDGIAVGPQGVYWTDASAGTVMRCPLNGSCQPTLIAAGEADPKDIGLDSTNVYWISRSSLSIVKECPLTGCGGSAVMVTSQPVAASNFTVGPTALYWSAADGSIMKVAK